MEVFSKSYLEEVVENQGKLFEYAEEHCPGADTVFTAAQVSELLALEHLKKE